MKLIDVKNGHYFVKAMFPSEIFKKIREEIYIDLAVKAQKRIKVMAILLNNGEVYVFFQPHLTEVIDLGE
tara:strand:+ start:878 stop:1087 length:210 start_codon:yes stop_codon:yes gene_type:complete